jgi:hypothetical protein
MFCRVIFNSIELIHCTWTIRRQRTCEHSMASLQDTRTWERIAHSHRVHRPLAVQTGAGTSGHLRAPVHGDHQRGRGGLVVFRLLRPWLVYTFPHFALPAAAGRRALTRADSARLDCLATESGNDSRICSTAVASGRRHIEQFISAMTRTPNSMQRMEASRSVYLRLLRQPWLAPTADAERSATEK